MSAKLADLQAEITKFGAAILSKCDGTAVVVPKIAASPEDVIQLFRSIKGEEMSEFDTGLFNVSDSVVSPNWESMNAEQKDEIRSILLKCASFNINERALGQFSSICVKIYNLTGSWQTLIDFMFSEPSTCVKAKIFVRFMASAAEKFVEENFAKIAHFLAISFPVVSISIQDKLIQILSSIGSDAAFKAESSLLDAFMNSMITILTEEPERQEFVVPVAIDVFVQAPKAAEIVPKSIIDAIEGIHDVASAVPLLLMFPVFNPPTVVALISKIIKIAELLISQNKALPLDLLDAVQESPIEDLSESVQEALASFFASAFEKATNVETIAVFAPLAAQVAEVYGEKKFFAIVDKLFNGNGLQIAAALYVYQCIAEYIDNLSFDISQSAIIRVFGYFANRDSEVRSCAFTTARTIICNKFVMEEATCQKLFDIFPSLVEADFGKFFKVVREAFRSEQNDESLPSIALEFAVEGLKKEKEPAKLADYLSIFSDISNVMPDILIPHIDSIVTVCINLMKGSDASAYKYASRALLGMIDDDTARRRIYALLPRFQALLSAESTISSQVQGNVAAAYASIVLSSEIKKEIPGLIDIAIRFATSSDRHLISAGALLSEMVSDHITPDVARNMFSKIAQSACTTAGKEQLNNLLNSLVAILEKYTIEESSVLPLFNVFVNGSHPIFEGKPVHLFHDKETEIINFLNSCVVKFTDLAIPASTLIVGWFSASAMQMFPVLLHLITTLVDMKKIEGEQFDVLSETLFQRIGTTHNDELDEIMLGVLMDLVQLRKDAIDPQRFVSKLIIIYEALDAENPTSWRASVAASILDLCAAGADVDIELIKDILSEFPGQPEENVADEMGSAIVSMIELGEKWSALGPFVAQVFCSILLKTQEEIKKYDFQKSTVERMKNTTKEILRKHKEIERSIVKSFNKNRQMLNRFAKLVK